MGVEVLPRTGIAPVALNMDKAQVEAALGRPTEEFIRSQFSDCLEWAYHEKGYMLAFDPAGHCIEVSAFEEADPKLAGVSLLQVPAPVAWAHLRSLDADAHVDPDVPSLISKALGILTFAPHIEEDPDEPAQMVMIFRDDYPEVR